MSKAIATEARIKTVVAKDGMFMFGAVLEAPLIASSNE